MELWTLQNSLHIKKISIPEWNEVDSVEPGVHRRSIPIIDLVFTLFSVLGRLYAVYINISLAGDYYSNGSTWNFTLLVMCIILPMLVTTLIYANMCYQDGAFIGGETYKILKALCVTFPLTFLFRYWKSLIFAIRSKVAEMQRNKEDQIKFFNLAAHEESDIALIRLFDCFLETSPQKILLITILFTTDIEISHTQVIALFIYIFGTAWSLTSYNRCIRLVQSDKYNISKYGSVMQILWHFFITVSRVLCIAFAASSFPAWTVVCCLIHAFVLGTITFAVDSPTFAKKSIFNYLFCLALGIVYLFTYIPVKDAPTRIKYMIFYSLIFVENLICILIFIWCTPKNLNSNNLFFYTVWVTALMCFFIGITFMVIYYKYCHPRVTARNSRRIINNN